MPEQRLLASSRVALAAYLHDLGKFAERARLPVSDETLDTHKQLYCPYRDNAGHKCYTHVHAAYSALAFDLIERHLPALKGQDFSPFAAVNRPGAEDSLINAAAAHHRPESFLQWIVATADRVASGFEREAFERYNNAEDITDTGRNHYQARQLNLLEGIRLNGEHPASSAAFAFRQPLRPLSPAGLFPQRREVCESDDNGLAQAEYARLWDNFLSALEQIPASHRESLPLWLDHFDSLWQTFTHAIPSATVKGTRPDVSLYDHSRTTAALATALWRYHADHDHNRSAARDGMRSRADWDEEKLLLIQGDFFGIQAFVFASGSQTSKNAARLLRGRSLYVSLIAECAALRVLEALDLPSTSQILNAAGKFLLVAPNTPETLASLQRLQQEIDAWFLEHSYGQSGLGLAWTAASCNQFVTRGREGGFRDLMARLFAQLERAKHRAFGLCGETPEPAVFTDYLAKVGEAGGVCDITGWGPADQQDGDLQLSALAADQIAIGRLIAGKRERLALTREPLSDGENSLRVPLFGYRLHFTAHEEASGRFGQEARSGNLRRLFDFSLPASADAPLWNGYARRAINGYVAQFAADADMGRYGERALPEPAESGRLKEFDHLACGDRRPLPNGKWAGIEGLGILKGDVDNLGTIFQRGLASPTFARMAALSRQVNAFFSTWLPWLCRSEFPDTYTVFAGGDDFFLIGPWHSLMRLAERLQESFADYVAHNPGLHFSVGLCVCKPGLPVPQLARMAEQALEEAKARSGKNAVHCFEQTLDWPAYRALLQAADELDVLRERSALPTAYLYDLLGLADLASDHRHIEHGLWRSRLSYRTWRLLQGNRQLDRTERQALFLLLIERLGENGIGRFQGAYRVALTTHLYLNRE
ncbi:HD domain-containing protein [Azotobacter armeniacus]